MLGNKGSIYIPSITQNKVSAFRIRSKASQCTPSPFFCAPMHLCTHALHEMARERGDLISSGMILFRVVGGSESRKIVDTILESCTTPNILAKSVGKGC